MPGLNDLLTVSLQGQQQGAYMEPIFFVDGLETPVGLRELLDYILANLGGEGGGGADNYVTAANLAGDTLTLTRVSGGNVTVDLSAIDTDTDDFVDSAQLQGNNLVLTMDSGSTVSVDLSSLAGGGGEANTSSNAGGGAGLALPKSGADLPFKSLVAGPNITITEQADTVTIGGSAGGGISISIYNAGLGFWVKGTAGITVTSGAAGVYNFDVPAGGILESFGKEFNNAGTDFTVGGEVLINIDWNTGAFNTAYANAVLPAFKLIPTSNQQYEPTSLAVTVSHTSVAGGATATTLANINGVGTPIRIKGIL